MNNIEILEEFIKKYKEVQEKYKDDEIQAEIERSCYFEEVPAQAIINLIQRLKDLEQIEKEHKEENGKLRDRIKELEKENKIIEEVLDETDNEYLKGYHDCNDEWETKIKEKMNNDIKTNKHTILGGRRNGKTLEYGIRLGRIQMCEELLEESENNMDIDEAKVILKEFNEDYEEENGIGDLAEGIAEMVVDWNDNEAIETILTELDKKDKIIDLMAYDLMHIGSIPYRENIFTKEQLIEQYANKVEEDK